MSVLLRFRHTASPSGDRRAMQIPWEEWIRGESSQDAVTVRTVLGVSAAWSCVMLLADLISGLPLDHHRKRPGQIRELLEPSAQILARPSTLYTRREWLFAGVVSAAATGNTVGLITSRDQPRPEMAGRAAAVEWVNPADVTVTQASPLARPRYDISGTPRATDDIVHLRRFPQPGSAVGLSPLDLHSDLFAIAASTRKYAAQWFRDGAHPTGILSTDSPNIDADGLKEAKRRFKDSLNRKREPVVLGASWKYTPVQASPDASRLSDIWNDVGLQVAQVYRVPPEMIGVAVQGSSITYANRDQRAADLKAFTLAPWLTMFEDWYFDQLPTDEYARFNVDAFLRSDPATRSLIQDRRVRMGGMSINEVRALEDQPPIEGGDQYLWPPYRAFPLAADQE